MNRRAVGWSLFAVSVGFLVLAAVIPFVWGAGWSAFKDLGSIALFGSLFVVVGLVINVRRPEHRIGWLFAGAGFFTAVQAASSAYADAAFRPGGHHLPAAAYAGNLTQWIFAPAVLLGYTLPFLWFPDGRLLSARWRWVVRVAIVSTLATCTVNILDSDPLNNYPHVANPLGVTAWALNAVNVAGLLTYIGALFAAIVSVFLRYRRSRGLERLQMRWFMVGVVGTGVAFLVQMGLLAATGDVGVGVVLLTILPLCATIAILRYRLFDIDRIVSRTVSYVTVTGLVVAPYLVLVLLASRVSRGSSVTVAALTLVALAMLRPAHRQLQRVVDRRFNRQRYDAARTIEAFAVRLRDEVDPEVVRSDLLAVTAGAIQPATLSMWLPSATGISRS